MITYVPSYYRTFKCIAGACRHSCCIGWEIDIDPDTLSRYMSIAGQFGDRLRRGIKDGSFALDADERCPFLNSRGLCDIILTMGEDALCEICTDHPRFRNFFPSRTEIGLGLCCESAAELILSQQGKFSLTPLDEAACPEADEYEAAFLAFRQRIFDLLQDRTLPLDVRMQNVLSACGAKLIDKSAAEWADVFLCLERLDDRWSDVLERMKRHCEASSSASFALPFEQLLVYFTFRHLSAAYDDGMIAARMALAVLSLQMVEWICASENVSTLDELAEIARLYSSEVEYSEDNICALLSILDI